MAKSQKQAVIDEVLTQLPNFQKYVDNAILLLSSGQLERIKGIIHCHIINGHVDYSKDRTNIAEVRTYARSMVMNHLKKAKELNGGTILVKAETTNNSGISVTREKIKLAPRGVNPDLLTPELREFVKTLV
jgi:hypothetical protein